MDNLLIITNGTSAEDAIREAGIDAHFCPWNDPLHDGPVPGALTPMALARVRARFIADRAWGDHGDVLKWFDERDARVDAAPNFEEVMLWFEHDLYDQLQLIQVLVRLTGVRTRVTLLQADHYIGYTGPTTLRHDFDRRRPVTREHQAVAALAWEAFTATEPGPAASLVATRRLAFLPHLTAAFVRWFETFPDVGSGLSRTERSVLRRVETGLSSPVDLFRATRDEEEAMFRGDWSFFELVRELTEGPVPMLETTSGRAFDPARATKESVSITDAGRRVLAGEADRIELAGIDTWRGGIHLTTDHYWRWSQETGFVEHRE